MLNTGDPEMLYFFTLEIVKNLVGEKDVQM